MQPRTRRALFAALQEARQIRCNFDFWIQAARLTQDHPTIPAAHAGWRVLHWLVRKANNNWFFRNMRDFVFESVGQSLGQFIAKAFPFAIAITLAIMVGDDLGQFVAVTSAILYGLAVGLLGPPVWFIAEMQADAHQAAQIVTEGQSDVANLEQWISAAEHLLASNANPPPNFVVNLRLAGAAVVTRIKRRPPTLPPSPPSI